jgi:parvulin-like peptidyl-prolyl isomerase
VTRTIGAIALSSALLCGCAARAPQAVVPPPLEDEARIAIHREYASVRPVRDPAAHRRLEEPLMLAAAAGPSTPAQDEAVARLPGLVITQKQFLAPLIEAHGLPVLLNVVQLELARQNAQRRGLVVTPADLAAERDRTLELAFGEADNKTKDQIDAAVNRGDTATAERLRGELKKDRERALEQVLAQQRTSRPEFELVIQTNAILRKLAEQEMKEIPEETVRKAFETEYGATVRVRHIQATSRQDLVQAQERLKKGEPFDAVARAVSRNPRTAPLGGELPQFSLATPNVPDNFKQVAFSLGKGEVSNVIECDGAYHLIKLEEKFAPRAVKFEGVRDSLRVKVREQVLMGMVNGLREQLAEQTRTALKIEDPVLREQFDRKLQDRDKQITDMNKIKEQQARERQLRQQQQAAPGAPIDPKQVLPVPGATPTPTPTPAPAPALAPPAPPAQIPPK